MQSMVKFLFSLLLVAFSQTTHALSETALADCKEAADLHADYSLMVDAMYREALAIAPRDSEVFNRWRADLNQKHHKYKGEMADKLYEMSEARIKGDKESRYRADTWRWIHQASIDGAYAAATENMLSGRLGQSKSHYTRKIYEYCVGRGR